MMEKLAKQQDPELNKAKAENDARAATLLHLDAEALKKKAQELSIEILMGTDEWPRVVVTGGAGAGKTTLAKDLAIFLNVKHLDLDEYIPGGFVDDKVEYSRRFDKGLYEMWEDVPPKKGWVIEHVEACHPNLVGLYRPDFAVLLDPGDEWLLKAVDARGGGHRPSRALSSNKTAKEQFKALSGEVTAKLHDLILKKL